jgi:hypothetical protein
MGPAVTTEPSPVKVRIEDLVKKVPTIGVSLDAREQTREPLRRNEIIVLSGDSKRARRLDELAPLPTPRWAVHSKRNRDTPCDEEMSDPFACRHHTRFDDTVTRGLGFAAQKSSKSGPPSLQNSRDSFERLEHRVGAGIRSARCGSEIRVSVRHSHFYDGTIEIVVGDFALRINEDLDRPRQAFLPDP